MEGNVFIVHGLLCMVQQIMLIFDVIKLFHFNVIKLVHYNIINTF